MAAIHSYFTRLADSSLKQQRFILLLVGLILIGSGLGLRQPWQIDEVRYVSIAMEMVQTGNWLIPHRAGEIYAEKPPLYFWIMATSLKLTGSIKVGFLLPSLFAGLFSLILFHDLLNRLFGREQAWFGSLLLLCTYQFFKQTQSAQIDALLFMWVMLGCYGLARHLLLGGNWRWCYVAFVAIGLGIVTKGVGFLPILLFIPYIAGRRLGFNNLTPLKLADPHWLGCIVAMLCGIAVWLGPVFYVALTAPNPDLDQYLQTILFKQTAQRYAHAWHHIEPWWFFLVSVIPVAWLPSIIFTPFYIKHWAQFIREKNGAILLFLGWFLLVLLFFSISSGKRDVYIFPGLIGWTLCCAAVMPTLLAARWFQRTAFVLTSVFAFLLLVFGILVLAGVGKAARWLDDPGQASLIFLSSAAWFIVCLIWAKPSRGARAFFTGFIGFAVVYGFMYLPMSVEKRTNTAMQQAIADNVRPGTTLVMPMFDEMLWYGNQLPMIHFGFYRDPEESEILAAQWLHAHPQTMALLSLKNKTKSDFHCFDLSDVDTIISYLKRKWILVPNDAVTNTCLSSQVEESDRIYQFSWQAPWRKA